MKRKRLAFVVVFALLLFGILLGTLQATDKGKLYLMSERKTLTQRAGIPCNEAENNFCHMNFHCPDGQVGAGMLLNMDDPQGTPIPTGFGLSCTDPNELYKKQDIGAVGDNFSGKIYREPCDVGFYLAGVKFSTNNRRTISGAQAVCRRYWPVEKREGINTFGTGTEAKPLMCEPGKFVTGFKTSYWRAGSDSDETGLYSIRLYCTEIREYLSTPKKKKDPRSN